MTRYTRNVIPGRGRSPSNADLDRQVFGAAANEDDPPEDRPGRDDDLFSRLPPPGAARQPPDPLTQRGNLLLVGVLAVAGLFGAIVWSTYREGVRQGDEAGAPLLGGAGTFKTEAAPEEPRPEATLPATEAQVYSRMEASREPPATTIGATTDALPEPGNSPAPTASAPPTPTAATPTLPSTPLPATQREASMQPPTPVAQKPPAADPPPPPLAGGFRPAFSRGGAHLVQLGAASSEAAAEAEWRRRSQSAGGLFDGAEKLIVRAEVNGKTVWRVRVGSFATAADADAFCKAIRTKGGDCFHATR